MAKKTKKKPEKYDSTFASFAVKIQVKSLSFPFLSLSPFLFLVEHGTKRGKRGSEIQAGLFRRQKISFPSWVSRTTCVEERGERERAKVGSIFLFSSWGKFSCPTVFPVELGVLFLRSPWAQSMWAIYALWEACQCLLSYINIVDVWRKNGAFQKAFKLFSEQATTNRR